LAALAAGLIAVRLVLLAVFGPIEQPDSAGYVGYADLILTERAWVRDALLDSGKAPVTAFRTIGYPAVIAAAKLIAGDAFAYAVVVLQCLVSVATTLALVVFAAALGLSPALALLAGAAQSLSLILVSDLNVLTDSLAANLTVLVLLAIAIGTLTPRTPRAAVVLGLGGLLASVMLLREATLYLAPVVAVGVALWARAGGDGIGRRLALTLLFLVPIVAVWQGCRAWNEARTGTPFVTTGVQFVGLMPTMVLADAGLPVLAPGSPVARAHAATAGVDVGPFQRAVDINRHLFAREGLRAPELAQVATETWIDTWRRAPLARAGEAIGEFRMKQAFVLVAPNEAARQIVRLSTGVKLDDVSVGLKRIRAGEVVRGGLVVAVETVQRLISATVFLAFVVGLPVLVIRGLAAGSLATSPLLVLGWLWLVSAALAGLYSLVHMELRYTLPAQAVAVPLGLWVLIVWRRHGRP
jgi:hypothetical protein